MVKLLYAEDGPNEHLKARIEKAGYKVLTAVNGDEAYAKISEKPDIILLDIMMPPGDKYGEEKDIEQGFRTGLAFLRDLQEVAPEIPVVVLTANPSREVRAAAMAVNQVCQFIHKRGTTSLNFILKTLREALEAGNAQ